MSSTMKHAYQAQWRRVQQRRWRIHGCCVACGLPTEVNARTGRPFSRCFEHRLAATVYTKTYHQRHGRAGAQ